MSLFVVVGLLGACSESSGPQRDLSPGFECSGAQSRLWRLTEAQYRNTAAQLFVGRDVAAADPAEIERLFGALRMPFASPGQVGRYSTTAGPQQISEADFTDMFDASQAIAELYVDGARADAASCLNDDPPARTCLRPILADKGALLLRRPLTDDELERYLTLAETTQAELGTRDALVTTFQALLLAPETVFRSELGEPSGDATRWLTSYEIAQALSYSITDAPPDPQLWEAARAGFDSVEAVRAQATRLLAELDEPSAVRRFFAEYFRFANATEVVKDLADYPGFNAELLIEDTRAFVRDGLREHGRHAFLEMLFSSDSGFVHAQTASTYGVTAPAGDGPQKVTFPAGQRAGVLSQPSWLVAHSDSTENQPIQRGLWIRENLLCQSVPDIEIDLIPEIQHKPETTLREELAPTLAGTCAGCHGMMNPLGYAFETYDHFGRFREIEAGRPVDASGAITGTGDQDGPYVGPIELTSRVLASSTARQCFARQSFNYWLGRDADQGDACTITSLASEYDKSGGDYAHMLTMLFTSGSFLRRTNP